MNASFEPAADSPRVAHLHARREWGEGEIRLLALVLRMQARGLFTVLATPAGGELARRARRAGVRVLALEEGSCARKQLELDLQEFNLTHLHAHDPESTALGRWLKRRLRISLVSTHRAASPVPLNPFLRWKYSPRRLDAVIATSETVRDVLVRRGCPAGRISIVSDGSDDEPAMAATLAIYVRTSPAATVCSR